MGNGRISAKQSEILEYIKEEILSKGYTRRQSVKSVMRYI